LQKIVSFLDGYKVIRGVKYQSIDSKTGFTITQPLRLVKLRVNFRPPSSPESHASACLVIHSSIYSGVYPFLYEIQLVLHQMVSRVFIPFKPPPSYIPSPATTKLAKR